MTTKIMRLALALTMSALSSIACGQATSLTGTIFPVNPTSADNIKFTTLGVTCGGTMPFAGNPYRVSMSQNNITINIGPIVPAFVGVCPPGAPLDHIEIGRLPAGNYTVTTVIDPVTTLASGLVQAIRDIPFTVTDARATKAAPYVRLDYTGLWWDPNDSGWGLFIWQDANSRNDSVLAAWFTYTPDGKPAWFVFQPTWATLYTTANADLLQTLKPPGPTSPPPGSTTLTAVGRAQLDFSNGAGIVPGNAFVDGGKITYTLQGGPTITRGIVRYKP